MESSLILVWQGGWIRAILQGAAITIAVGTVSMLVGALIGTLCGVTKWARIFPLTLVVDAYTSLVRGCLNCLSSICCSFLPCNS